MFFFSGVFFPLDKVPDIVKLIAEFIPLTHAVLISRAIFAGNINLSIAYHFAFIIIPALIAFVIAMLTMKRRIIK